MSRPDAPARQGAAKRYAPLIAVVGIILLIMAAAFLAHPGLGVFRHSDPAQARSSMPSAIDMALMYASVVGSISQEDFSNASLVMERLDAAYIPDSVRYTFARFNSLLSLQISELNATESVIADALRYARLGLIENARQGVINATWMIAGANITWSDLSDAADELSSQFKMRTLTPEMDLIMEVIQRYLAEAADVADTVGKIESGNLTRTSITLTVGASELISGVKTWASGTLQSENGTALPGMPVSIHAGKSTVAATTDAEGHFNATVAAAGYAEKITVSASFLQQQGYAGCASGEETILVNFIKPSLAVALDRELALPGQGLTVTVSLDLSAWAHEGFAIPLPEAEGAMVSVTAFGQEKTAHVQGGSEAQVQFTVPDGTPDGSSQIATSGLPDGFVGPASATAQINVYRHATTVSIDAPGYAVGGFSFPVSGVVWANGTFLPNATVSMSVKFAGGSTDYYEGTTDGSGRFSITVPTGALMQTGTARIDAEIFPAEDWYADGYGGTYCYVISPITIATPLLALGAMGGGIALMRSRRGKGQYPAQGGMVAVAALPRQMQPEGTIAGAYARAASWVGSALKRRIKPSDTAREYYAKVSPSLGEAREPFRDLTLMLEESLYGLKEASIPASKGLLGRIRALLGMGPAQGGPER